MGDCKLLQNNSEVPTPCVANYEVPTSLKETVTCIPEFAVNEEIAALRRANEEMITMMKEHLSSSTSKLAYDQFDLPSRGVLQDGAQPPRSTPSTFGPPSCCSVMRHTGSDSQSCKTSTERRLLK